MAKYIKVPAGSKIESVKLRLANNGGIVICVEHRTPSISKGQYDNSFDYARDYELAYTTYAEAEPAIEEAATMMGAKLSTDSEEEEYEEDM